MRLALTGAGGFVGQTVIARALACPKVTSLAVSDRALPPLPPDPRLRAVPGDIAEPAVRAALLDGADAVIHLAAVLGGAAEADPAASRRINLDATLDLMALAAGRRFVLASSIAVLGPPPARIDDDTACAPRMVYAMHKRMTEVALETASLRGELDGFALRLPGVVARPGPGTGLKSAFLSDLFHAMRAGRCITLPVAPEGRSAIASVRAVAAGVLHAALLPRAIVVPRRTLLLPALCPSFAELVTALQRRHPDAPPPHWRPDSLIMEAFGRFGELHAGTAIGLGFPHDASLDALIGDALTY